MSRIKSGYIKLDRKILDWRWSGNPNTFSVFIHLLLMANYEDMDFENTQIHRGSCATSYENIGAACGISYEQARTAVSHLQQTGEITITRRSRFLVITIINYSEYQSFPNQNPIISQSNPNQNPIKSQQWNKRNKGNKGKERNKGVAGAPPPPSGGRSGLMPNRDEGTVEDIPLVYRDGTMQSFTNYADYWDWRNQ